MKTGAKIAGRLANYLQIEGALGNRCKSLKRREFRRRRVTISHYAPFSKRNGDLQNNVKIAENAVNINTASVEELEKLPDIGAKLAQRIVEHREKYGKFRKPEHLILVQGISDKRFRQIQNLIKTE
jgi:competence ComEA-like helix-hairpin-helix protein